MFQGETQTCEYSSAVSPHQIVSIGYAGRMYCGLLVVSAAEDLYCTLASDTALRTRK